MLIYEYNRETDIRVNRTEAYAEGLEKGRSAGLMQANTESARRMKTDGLSPEVISKYVGLPVSEIQAL